MAQLTFADPRRERLFRIFDERHAAPGIRALAAIALVIVLAIGVADAHAIGWAGAATLLWRGVMAAAAVALLIFRYRSGVAGGWSLRLAAAAAVFGVAEALLLATAEPHYRRLHSPGMALVVALCLTGLRLRFAHALALALALDVAHVAGLLFAGVAADEMAVQLTLLGTANAVGLFVAYGRDQARRRHFLEVLALQTQRAKLGQLTRQLRELSLRDELTGLPNRRQLETLLAPALAATERHQTTAVVAMIDLDRFKSINDEFGHAAGDVMLRRTARALLRGARASDTVFRIGGDEFCVLLPQTSLPDGMEAVDRMLARVTQGLRATGVTASAGCAESRPGETGEALLQRADAALYRAKATGRGRVHGAPSPRSTEIAALPAAS